MILSTAQLMPQVRTAHRRKKQAANALGNLRLLQVGGIAFDLNALTQCAQGGLIQRCKICEHIVVGIGEMLGLTFGILEASRQTIEHGFLFRQLAFNREHSQRITECSR